MPIDHRHRETVIRILEAIAAVEHNPARALVALEDVSVAIYGGMACGVRMPRIAKLADEAFAEIVEEERVEDARSRGTSGGGASTVDPAGRGAPGGDPVGRG